MSLELLGVHPFDKTVPVNQGIIADELTQRTVKFIRWLKNHLDSTLSWAPALARLGKIYTRSGPQMLDTVE